MSTNISTFLGKTQKASFKPLFISTTPTTNTELSHYYRPDTAVQSPVLSTGAKNLDTLAQLRKRARNKYVTNGLVYQLAGLESPLQKQYWNTYHCGKVVKQEGNRLVAEFCNNRWCNVCNRIRTAKLIKGYLPVLEKIEAKYFVTLTIPNVPDHRLEKSIRTMHKVIRNMSDMMRKRKTPIIGLRKLECTYNSKLDNYHPHFHLIVSGKHIAETIVSEWLVTYPDANIRGQDIRPADDNSVKELFKYFSKLITKNPETNEVGFNVKSLDIIFRAMKGKRVFQPMGIKKISEAIDSKQIVEVPELKPTYKSWVFNDDVGDWCDLKGNTLTGHVPSATMRKIRGLPDVVLWDDMDDRVKATQRIDDRKYWKERANYWESVCEAYSK